MEVDAAVNRAGRDALAALGADGAVDAAPGRRASLGLGERRLDLGEVGRRGDERRAVRRSAAAERVCLLAGEDRLLVDDRQPVVEAVQGAAGQPAVDHVRRAASLADGAGDVGGAVDRVAGGEDVRGPGLERISGSAASGPALVGVELAGEGAAGPRSCRWR